MLYGYFQELIYVFLHTASCQWVDPSLISCVMNETLVHYNIKDFGILHVCLIIKQLLKIGGVKEATIHHFIWKCIV